MTNDKPRWKGARFQSNQQSQAAIKVFNINKIEVNYLNPQYKLDIEPDYAITDQGLLLVGKLMPTQQSLPSFSLRWDEKDDHLNVDILPEDNCWQNETKGYKGHRPQKTDQYPGRAYALIVKTPTLNVVDAIISFNLARDVSIS